MRGKLLCFAWLTFISFASAQTGPGGVGTSATNTLWLRAGDIGQSDNSSVSSWSDQSGNSNDASQSNSSYYPTYQTNEVNGHAVVRFDGVDDYFDDNRSYNAQTVIIVYQIRTANQATSDLGQIWGNYAEGVHVSLDARNSPGTWSFDANNSVSNTGRLGLNGAAYGAYNGNPSSPNWTYDQFDIVTSEFNAARSVTRQVIGSLVPSFSVGQHQYGGDVAELIVYNTTINDAQRIIVENYLAAKYGISITNDNYAHQSTHAYDVVGIGRASAGNEHTSSTSGGLVRIENASSLGDGDYLIFGHDNGGIGSWVSTESPDGGTNIQHLSQEWIWDETNDVGTIDLTVDVNTLPTQPGTHNMYALLVDADGDFSSGASVYELVFSSGTEYDISGLDINDGDYFTIASMRGTVEHTLTSSSDTEPNNASVEVEINFIPQTNLTVDYTTADGTATVAGLDYTAASPGTLTITAPATSNSYNITINNDVAVEVTETFTITLSNPSRGAIGANSVHTYGISDDDNPRKIYFDLSASNGSESVTSGNIAVSINSADGSNPTTVDYAITGGTAEGGGTDYTLASGTLTIIAGQTTNNIPFTVNDESLFESNETFEVTFSNPTNCNLDAVMPYGGTGFIVHTYTINDDDTAPVIEFNTTASNGPESTSPANIQVDLSTASGTDASVNFVVTGTASGGGVDYTLADGTFTITAGNTSGNIQPIIIDDSDKELDETIIITISSPTGATLGSNTVHTFTIDSNDLSGIDGPGGIGETSNLMLWLRGDDIGLTDLTAVSSWSDFSGNNHDATQGSGTLQPIYRTNIVNGHSVVRFDGTDDYFSDNYNYSARTVFVVYQVITANQSTADLGQVWGSYGDGVQVSLDARNSPGTWSFDGSGSNQGQVGVNGAVFGGLGENPASPNWSYDAFEIIAVQFDANRSVTSQDIGDLISPTGHNFGGDLAELIVFNVSTDQVLKYLVENYLSAKYNIAITTDLFAYDSPGNYEYEVAGLGRVSSTDFHDEGKGTGKVRISNPSDLGDDEFLLWGHDNGEFKGTEYSDIPASGVDRRIERVWRVSELNTAGSAIDVGSIDILFNLSGFMNVTASDLRLLIDTDNDGVFTDETAISGAIDAGGGYYGFYSISSITDGLRFSLGTSDEDQTPLPIELLSFKAELDIKRAVQVSWVTSSETNNDFFTLERSVDLQGWAIVTKVDGAGNSRDRLSYQYSDESPLEGISYYRLKQTDFDGQFSYSHVEKVNNSTAQNDLTVYPNPARNNLRVIVDKENAPSLKIYNALGQDVTRQVVVMKNDNQELLLNVEKLDQGLYIVKINQSSASFLRK